MPILLWGARKTPELDQVKLDSYKVVLYRNQPDGWVAEAPPMAACYALIPTHEEEPAELGRVFEMIAAEYQARRMNLSGCDKAVVNLQSTPQARHP